ncbi:MAG: HAD family hydrolase [Eubacterium sp.]
MSKKGIIFDLDGTLWDASHSNAPAWNVELRKHSEIDITITAQDLQSYMGKTIEEIAKIVFPHMEEKERVSILKKCCKEEIVALRQHGGILFPDLKETLEELGREYYLYIVSNCQDGYVQAFLDYHKMNEYFEDIEMAGRTGKNKAENIRLIVCRNHLDQAVYVGDTAGDYKSTKDAGLQFVYAKYGFGTVEDAEYSIDRISDLVDVVKNIL